MNTVSIRFSALTYAGMVVVAMGLTTTISSRTRANPIFVFCTVKHYSRKAAEAASTTGIAPRRLADRGKYLVMKSFQDLDCSIAQLGIQPTNDVILRFELSESYSVARRMTEGVPEPWRCDWYAELGVLPNLMSAEEAYSNDVHDSSVVHNRK
jgi:hypothetical protein